MNSSECVEGTGKVRLATHICRLRLLVIVGVVFTLLSLGFENAALKTASSIVNHLLQAVPSGLARQISSNSLQGVRPSITSSRNSGAAYPLRVSGNGRYLVDRANTPFLMVGDSPQALIANLSESDADYFLANRQAAGFNTVWVNLLCNTYTGCRSDGTTYDGIPPFLTPGDLSTPNDAYFTRADHMLQLAAQHGINVILDPIETGGWLSVLQSNGATKAYNYGVYLGNRYKNVPNLLWMSGNDFQSWSNATDDTLVRSVAQGIRSADPNHLHTVELDYLVSSSLDDATWAPLASLNAAYTYHPTYAEVLHAYNQAPIPVFMVEANYEFENNTGNDYGSPLLLRRQEYWTALSGSTGQLYGNYYTWPFRSGWKNHLDTTGSQQFRNVTNLLAGRRWWTLVPDQNHAVVTAGYGTFSATGAVHSNDYVTAARTPDGKLILAYLPTVRTITVNMSQLSGAVTAQWYDPTEGAYASISGSPFSNNGLKQFTPPGSNAAGDGDWVLVLEANEYAHKVYLPTVGK